MIDRGPRIPQDDPSLRRTPADGPARIAAADPWAAEYPVADGPLAGKVLTGSVTIRYAVTRLTTADPPDLKAYALAKADVPTFDPGAFPTVPGFYASTTRPGHRPRGGGRATQTPSR
jgi:hypothetical protein